MRKQYDRIYWTISVTLAVILGVLSVLILLIGGLTASRIETLAEVLAQLAGSVLVAATLVFQYFAFRKEQLQYMAERNTEQFFRLVDELSKAIASFRIVDLCDKERQLVADDAIVELCTRLDLVNQILTDKEFTYHNLDTDELLVEECNKAESLHSEFIGTEPKLEVASGDAVKNARHKLSEYRTRKDISRLYSVDRALWQRYQGALPSDLASEIFKRFWDVHTVDLRKLYYTYLTIDVFLLQHPTYRQDKYMFFLRSQFSAKHIELLSFLTTNLSLVRNDVPTLLLKLLGKLDIRKL